MSVPRFDLFQPPFGSFWPSLGIFWTIARLFGHYSAFSGQLLGYLGIIRHFLAFVKRTKARKSMPCKSLHVVTNQDATYKFSNFTLRLHRTGLKNEWGPLIDR
jgi:hypothetical protein